MRLFISYAHDDVPICKQFVKLLDAHEVWYDQNLRGGEEWWLRILDRLTWCEGVIYLLSPVSIQSEYCRREAQIALDNDKIIIPVIINRRVEPPESLQHIQHIDLSTGLDSVGSILQLMNALFFAERAVRIRHLGSRELSVSQGETVPPAVKSSHNSSVIRNLPYNYIYRLEQRGLSERTKYVYIRWVCDYLERVAGFPRIPSNDRTEVLSRLPVDVLEQCLTVGQINAWLGMLKSVGVSKISIAKVALVAFVEALAEEQIVDKDLVGKIRAIEAYKLDYEKRPRRLLNYDEFTALLAVQTAETKLAIRNATVLSLLMVLRTGEVVRLRWSDISILGQRVTVRNPITSSSIHLPSFAYKYLMLWYNAVTENDGGAPLEDTFVIRRFLHGDRILPQGVSTNALQEVLADIARNAGIGKLSPDDLRISIRKLMEQKGRELFR